MLKGSPSSGPTIKSKRGKNFYWRLEGEMWTKGKVEYSVCFPFGDMAGLAEGKCSHLCYSLTVIWAQKSTHKIQTVEIPGLFNTIFVHQNLN